ncbi:MAG: HD domain-containing protein, partial [bacterium]
MNIEELINEIKKKMENADISVVKKAYNYAKTAHQDQKRVSGEPFIKHPLGVAYILANLGLDIISIAAALLHDVVEDTDITSEDIIDEFGKEISLLVDGVTKLTQLKFKSKEEHQAESLRKMFLAMAEDIRVVLIKLADRLHNMRTLEYLNKEKRKEKARETIEIYAPLAHRLGMSRIKWELEDLSFKYLYPSEFEMIKQKLGFKKETRLQILQQAINEIQDFLHQQNISNVSVLGRCKSIYS